MLKRILLAIGFCSLLFFSCNTAPEGFTIKGEMTGDLADGTKVLLQKPDSLNRSLVAIDTTEITNGLFEFTGTADEAMVHYLSFDGVRGNAPLVVENGTISFSAQKDSIGFSKVKGTPQNDIFMAYLEETRKMGAISRSFNEEFRMAQQKQDTAAIESLRAEYLDLQERAKSTDVDFIKANPNGLISVLILERAVTTKGLPAKELKELYDGLSAEMQDTKAGKRVGETITKLLKTAIGSPAPSFSGPTPEGQTLALSDVKGKVVLVDFWAGWCKPCRLENPNIVSVYQDYKDKGFNVLGVSLDRKDSDWKNAIAADGLEWNHISNLQYFQDPIAQLYQVNAIPAAFLLDENGIIIAKNLRGAALREKVAELLD